MKITYWLHNQQSRHHDQEMKDCRRFSKDGLHLPYRTTNMTILVESNRKTSKYNNKITIISTDNYLSTEDTENWAKN